MRAAAFLGVAAAVAVGYIGSAVLIGCPSPNTGPTQPVPAETILVELQEAGCLDPTDDAGMQAVQLAVIDSSGAPPWWGCLRDGGTPSSCGMPCYPAAKLRDR